MNQHPDWHQIVRDHWPRTTGYLLAGSQPCIRIRDEELEAIKNNRVLVGLSPSDLMAWKPSGSWLLGVLLCPGENTEHLVHWLAHPSEARRIHFYLHPDTSWEVLRPWHDAGLPTDQVDDDVDSWQRLHKLFGLALSERVVKDWQQEEQTRALEP